MNTSVSSSKLIDVAWAAFGGLLLIICGFGLMFVSAAYLVPLILGSVNCEPGTAGGSIIEFIVLFGSLGIGFAVALGFLSFLTRRFVSLGTHKRWVRQFHEGAGRLPYLQRKVSFFILKLMSPPDSRSYSPGSDRCNLLIKKENMPK